MNHPLQPLANTLNADLIPRIRAWLRRAYPEEPGAFTDAELSTLLCYALAPENFTMPTASDAVKACPGHTKIGFKEVIALLPDAGLICIHNLMTRHPKLTVATLAQFQHEDEKLLRDKLRRAIRRENLEGMMGNELVQYLIDTKQISEFQRGTARRKLTEMRAEDLANLTGKDLSFYAKE